MSMEKEYGIGKKEHGKGIWNRKEGEVKIRWSREK